MDEAVVYDFPRVSIVIPAYNAQETIGQCLQSIKELNYPADKIETIVVDNGSTDSTFTIAEQYHVNILSEPDLHVGALRNKGAQIANCEALAFTDSDCLVSKDWLDTAIRYLSMRGKSNISKSSSIGIVTGRISIPKKSTWVERAWAMNRGRRQNDKLIGWASSMNMVIKKRIFEEVGGFSDELITCEDVDLSSKVINTGDSILYTEKMQITHLGEAKTFVSLYRKEFWRGKGGVRMLWRNRYNCRRWIHSLQIFCFWAAMLGIFFSIVFLSPNGFLLSMIGLFFLPLLRATNISLKSGNVTHFFELISVWLVYYFARSSSFFLSALQIGINCAKKMF